MREQTHTQRTWGFRFSATDGAVLALAFLLASALYIVRSPLSWLLLIVITHFFLFCNVFRVRRAIEYAWALLFIVNVGSWVWFSDFAWTRVLVCQLPISAAFILAETRSNRYHGVFAQRINPGLEQYLRGEI